MINTTKKIKFSSLTIWTLLISFTIITFTVIIFINKSVNFVVENELNHSIKLNNDLSRMAINLLLNRNAVLLENMISDEADLLILKNKFEKHLYFSDLQHNFEFLAVRELRGNDVFVKLPSSGLDDDFLLALDKSPLTENQWKIIIYEQKIILCFVIPVFDKNTGRQSMIAYGGIILNENLSLYNEIANLARVSIVAVVYQNRLIGSVKSFDKKEMHTVYQVLDKNYDSGFYDDMVFGSQVFPMQSDNEIILYTFNKAGLIFALSNVLYQNLLLVFGVLGIIFISLSVLFVKLITKPLTDLINYASDVSKGVKNVSIKSGVIKEIDLLSIHLKSSIDEIVSNREQIKSISDSLNDGFVYCVDSGKDFVERNFIYISAGIEKILSLKPEAVYKDSKILYSLIAPDYLEKMIEKENQAVIEKHNFSIEVKFLIKDNIEKYLLISSSPKLNSDGHLLWYGVALDISAKKNAENELKKSMLKSETLNFIVNHSPAYAFLWLREENWPVEYVSENVFYLLGYDSEDFLSGEILFADTIHPDDLERVNNEIDKNLELGITEYNQEYRLVTKNGDIKWVDDRTWVRKNEKGILYYFQGILLDITERKEYEEAQRKLTEQLHHSQKMDAIGQLAGGVAHDFNNALSAIMNSAELIKSVNLSKDKQKEILNIIILATERARELTDKLLAFSRKKIKNKAKISCVKVINDTISILGHTLDKKVKLSFINKATEYFIIGNDSLLQNALVNMGINASHAMLNGGELLFSLANISLDENYCRLSPFNLNPGNYIEISVRDTGAGIKPEDMSRIFEPFFTTKEHGKGTGLGLAMVYGMVQELDGAITVYSELGVGTVFHIYLPVLSDVESVSEISNEVLSGEGTILLIEDEELIRETGRALMESLGYRVLVAENGLEGFNLFIENQEIIDIIILDMIMPVMNGKETFLKIREMNATVPIIISSGFTKDKDFDVFSDYEVSGFLQKPFSRVELSEIIWKNMRK